MRHKHPPAQPHLRGWTLGWNTVPMRSPAMILGILEGSTALQPGVVQGWQSCLHVPEGNKVMFGIVGGVHGAAQLEAGGQHTSSSSGVATHAHA